MAIEIRTIQQFYDNIEGTKELILMNDIECSQEEFHYNINCDINLNNFSIRHIYLPSASSIKVNGRIYNGYILGLTENSFNSGRVGANYLFNLGEGGLFEDVTLTATIDSLSLATGSNNLAMFNVEVCSKGNNGFTGCNFEILFNNVRKDSGVALINWFGTNENSIIRNSRFKITCPGTKMRDLFREGTNLPRRIEGCLFEGDYKYFTNANSKYCSVYYSLFMPKQGGSSYTFVSPGFFHNTSFNYCLYNSDWAEIKTSGLVGLTDEELKNPYAINAKGKGFVVTEKQERWT